MSREADLREECALLIRYIRAQMESNKLGGVVFVDEDGKLVQE